MIKCQPGTVHMLKVSTLTIPSIHLYFGREPSRETNVHKMMNLYAAPSPVKLISNRLLTSSSSSHGESSTVVLMAKAKLFEDALHDGVF